MKVSLDLHLPHLIHQKTCQFLESLCLSIEDYSALKDVLSVKESLVLEELEELLEVELELVLEVVEQHLAF
jgi:hypothetical protein